jgi:hypothetical protein
MTRQEAWEIIKHWEHWNQGQMSMQHATGGPRTEEDDIYDERRKLIKSAYAALNQSKGDK